MRLHASVTQQYHVLYLRIVAATEMTIDRSQQLFVYAQPSVMFSLKVS